MIKRVLSIAAVLGVIALAAVAMKSTTGSPEQNSAELQTVGKPVLAKCSNCETCECDDTCDGESECCVNTTCCADGDCCSKESCCSDSKCDADALACSCETCECNEASAGESECCVNKTCCANGDCCKPATDGLPPGIIDLGIDVTPKQDTT